MRLVPVLSLIALCAGVAGCTTTPADGSPKIQTTSEANQENVQGAVAAPLRDLNVVRTKIPDVLLDAMADPYRLPPRVSRTSKTAQCAQLGALIRPLDDALGPDLDSPSRDEDGLMDKGRDTALGMVAGAASDAIPFRGWVRKLSGAERHDKLVQSAIIGGAVRRAYLKGLGETRGCNPPATPSHQLTMAEPPVDRMKPRYPIR